MTGQRKSETEMMRETVGGEEEDAVTPLSSKRVYGSGSGSDSVNVGSNRSRAIAKYRRGKISSDSKNGSNQNSCGRTIQAQGQG